MPFLSHFCKVLVVRPMSLPNSCGEYVCPMHISYHIGIRKSILRIDSPKILLWQKRCLMRESYQPLLWENQAAGRKRGYDEYDKPERAVGSGCSTLPSGPRRGAHAYPGGVPRQYRLPSQVCPELAQSPD